MNRSSRAFLLLTCCNSLVFMIRRANAWTWASRRRLTALDVQTSYLESLRTSSTSSSYCYSSSPPSPSSSSSSSSSKQECITLWDEVLPIGARCVGLQLNRNLSDDNSNNNNYNHKDWLPSELHPDEIEYGRQLPSVKTKQSFWLGRLALRKVIDTSEPMLKDSYGRPKLPEGYMASISHKGTVGVALVQSLSCSSSSSSSSFSMGSLGVDLEYSQPQSDRNVARKVLTLQEQQSLGQIPTITPEEEVLLRFSMKESLYKAMHPYLCQYVGFQQVEIQPTSDGHGDVQLLLPMSMKEQLGTIQLYWQRMGPYFLSSCRVDPPLTTTTPPPSS